MADRNSRTERGEQNRARRSVRFDWRWLLPLAAILLLTGCARTTEPQYTASADVRKLPAALQEEVLQILTRRCGTVREPQMLNDRGFTVEQMSRGRQVYARRCQCCHGVTGDGNGPAAATLIPKPRDYRKGIFKFTSTTYGARPRPEDLMRTLRRGIPGTSMPSFDLLPKEDLEAVVDYVQALAMRGEFEAVLAREAPDYWDEAVELARGSKGSYSTEEATQHFRKAFVEAEGDARVDVARKWKKARDQMVTPLTPQPVFTAEHVARGRGFFLNASTGCFKCHGEDGRGQTPENLRGDLKDLWGHPTQAADLTSGMLRGGSEPIDVYRRIYSGINGTPMPSFATIYASDPDKVWDIVAFVLSVSNERRRGSLPHAAIGPMPGLRADSKGRSSLDSIARVSGDGHAKTLADRLVERQENRP